MLRIVALLLPGLLAGCANNTRIEATDRGVFLPMGRVSANLTGRQGAPSEPQGGHASVSGASRLEAYMVQALGHNAAVRAGYAAWSIISERENASDIHVRFSGPALGLDLLF